jgi:molybdopterin biosynthesis enzyme MoaB
LTVSDTAAADDQYDKSGPLIKERLAATPCYDIIESSIVPDDKDAISRAVLTFVHEQKAALLLTTGGTGFGPRDVTPEVRNFESVYSPLIYDTFRLSPHFFKGTPQVFSIFSYPLP